MCLVTESKPVARRRPASGYARGHVFGYALALLVAAPLCASAQTSMQGADTAALVPEPGDVLGAARSAQASYERRRDRYFPFTFSSPGGTCDEVVGRICTWWGEGEWSPEPEAEEAVELRRGLLAELDSLHALLPSDSWVLGQRVWYRAEGGDWEGALDVARGCGTDAWWCAALEGLALHGLGRHGAAEAAFERALAGMDPERARSWRVPERAVDPDARRWLRDRERAGPDSLRAALETLWRWADPLYLVEGNDRLTEHYARWTVATLKDGARNPFRLRWGSDLEELTVRHGWEIGWERSPGRTVGGPYVITAHKHPEAREYVPAGRTLAAPAGRGPRDFVADPGRGGSLYAPPYAPVTLPMEGQWAVFPRVEATVIVATAFLPEDTSFHAGHDHARPWMEKGNQAGMPDRIGLFAVSVAGGATRAETRTGTSAGALTIELGEDTYVVSVESWSPELRRAGRMRFGLAVRPAVADVASLSDVLLLDGDRPTPAALDDALAGALPRAEIRAGDRLAIAFEVAGLGFRPEVLQFALSVERTDRNVFRRLGEFFGLSERPPSLALSWEEPGPERPGPVFRGLDLDLPDMDPGEYEVVLTLRTDGRSDVVTRRAFRVVDP